MSVPAIPPENIDPTGYPWRHWPDEINQKLWDAGFVTADQIRAATNRSFARKTGLDPDQLEAVRGIVPRPTNVVAVASRPGPGPLPSEIRNKARSAFYDVIPKLIDTAYGKGEARLVGVCEQCGHEQAMKLHKDEVRESQVAYRDRVAAANLLGKYGVGEMKGVPKEDLVEYLRMLGVAMQEELKARFDPDAAADATEAIFNRWRQVSRERMG